MKETKKSGIRLPKVKNNNNKMFVEMIRKEEEERKVKT